MFLSLTAPAPAKPGSTESTPVLDHPSIFEFMLPQKQQSDDLANDQALSVSSADYSVFDTSKSTSTLAESAPSARVGGAAEAESSLGFDSKTPKQLDEPTRRSMIAQAQDLLKSLQKPEETIWHLLWESGSQRGCIRTAIDVNIFDILSRRNNEHVTAEQLAQITGAQAEFLVRILRVLTAIDFVREVGFQTYTASPTTMAMRDPGLASGFKICNDHGAAIQGHMSCYFRENGYQSPESASRSPFRWHFRTGQSYFEKIYSDPESTRDFDTFMASQRLQSVHWSSWFPVDTEILQPVAAVSRMGTKNPVSVVDIGGGSGHDLTAILNAFPDAPGQFIVQDLPEIVFAHRDGQDSARPATAHDKVQMMSHDMFKPQPIEGARVYYLRIVLHDWPDAECTTVLTNIAKVMKRGWSRIFLNELVVPEIGCSSHTAAADINMMCNFAGRERTQREWERLAVVVGLQVTKIWQHETSKTSLVELQLQD